MNNPRLNLLTLSPDAQAVKQRVARCDADVARYHLEGRGLARAVLTQQAEARTFRNAHRDVISSEVRLFAGHDVLLCELVKHQSVAFWEDTFLLS